MVKAHQFSLCVSVSVHKMVQLLRLVVAESFRIGTRAIFKLWDDALSLCVTNTALSVLLTGFCPLIAAYVCVVTHMRRLQC